MMDGGAKKASPCQWIRTAQVDAQTPGSIERSRHPPYLVAMTARRLHSALFGNRDHDSSGDRGTRGRLDLIHNDISTTPALTAKMVQLASIPTKVPSSSPSTTTHLLEMGCALPRGKRAPTPRPYRRPFLVDAVVDQCVSSRTMILGEISSGEGAIHRNVHCMEGREGPTGFGRQKGGPVLARKFSPSRLFSPTTNRHTRPSPLLSQKPLGQRCSDTLVVFSSIADAGFFPRLDRGHLLWPRPARCLAIQLSSRPILLVHDDAGNHSPWRSALRRHGCRCTSPAWTQRSRSCCSGPARRSPGHDCIPVDCYRLCRHR